ncbi:MAG: hypothetical protein D9C04_03060 [Nitrosopumilus sp. B06]|nr:MAG: hypothetical protein D9C04_03060 [Nitrosopumilus sp. B06]
MGETGWFAPDRNSKILEDMPKEVNYDIVVRIGLRLQDGEDLTKTNLARLCKMNYCRCKQYLNWMKSHNYVAIDKYVRLTASGALFIMISS